MLPRHSFREMQPRITGRALVTSLGVAGLLALTAACGSADNSSIHPETVDSGISGTTVPADPNNQVANPELADGTWTQDFSKLPDGPLPGGTWRYDLDPLVPTYNNEQQAYTNSQRNVYIQDGLLVIRAIRETGTYDGTSVTYPFTSGRIDTLNSFGFQYGKLEAVMKLPEGQGAWPAFWLLSANGPYTQSLSDSVWETDDRTYLRNGELDIVERYGGDIIEGTVITYLAQHEGNRKLLDATTAFHNYGIELTPTKIIWSLDGQPYFTYDKPSNDPLEWPFQGGNTFYPILNVAIGGSGGGEVDPALTSCTLEVRSITFSPYDGT